MGKLREKMSKAGVAAKNLYMRGQKWVYLFYTREVAGKRVPNYKRIALTAAVVAAAGAGAYAYYRHKKYGHVFKKKTEAPHTPPMGPM